MLRAFRDPPFLRLFIGAALILTALAFIAHRMAWRPVTAPSVTGTYLRAPVRFLKVAHLPEKLVLNGDGTMALYSPDGERVFAGAWRLDEKERVLRVDDPAWDRRIRIASTLLGPRLRMRISGMPFSIDHHEHDEEVGFKKDGPAPVNER